MKKLIAVLLAASMLLAFAACAKDETPADPTTTAPVETVEDIFATPETTAPANGETAAPVDGETTAAPVAAMTQAEFVAFLNAETAKAANGSYNFNRNCTYTDEIDVGDSTDALNSVIAMVDKESNLSTVVGGFLGIGTKEGAYPTDEPDEDYRLRATKLQESDIKNFTAGDNGVYTFTLANAANPKKTNDTPLHRFTNDFITHEEVDESIKDTAKGLITLNSTDVDYTNIKVRVTVADGKITSLVYQYDFAATLQVRILVGNVDGDGAAKTTGQFTDIKY